MGAYFRRSRQDSCYKIPGPGEEGRSGDRHHRGRCRHDQRLSLIASRIDNLRRHVRRDRRAVREAGHSGHPGRHRPGQGGHRREGHCRAASRDRRHRSGLDSDVRQRQRPRGGKALGGRRGADVRQGRPGERHLERVRFQCHACRADDRRLRSAGREVAQHPASRTSTRTP